MKNNLEQDNQKAYTFTEIYYVFRKHTKSICATILSVIILVTIFTFTSESIYRSSSTIMVNQDPNSMNILNVGFNNERNFIDNEMGILRSRTTAELVVKKMLDSNKKNNLYIFDANKSND